MLGEEEMDLLRKRNRVEIRVEEITMELEMVQLKNREMARKNAEGMAAGMWLKV